MTTQGEARGYWGSKLGFILAAAGSAVGLGNIWRFPYLTYSNEGGAFVLTYLICVLAVGLPIMIAEITIGRRTQLNPVGAMRSLGGSKWSWVGWLGVATGFIILSFYSVVAGWTLGYVVKSISGAFNGQSYEQVGQQFSEFVTNPWKQILWHGVFMGLTTLVVAGGVHEGIERATKVLMPVLFVILVALMITAMTTSGASEALRFMFRPNFGELTMGGFLEAMGQAFFSMSLGMGAMITYGSYMRKKDSIPNAALTVGLLDTLIAIMACLMIFPIIFTYDLTVTKSSGILFTTLPVVFLKMPGGNIISVLFFSLVAFAALTSTISLLEVVASYFIDQLHWTRRKATVMMGSAIFGFGILSALSLGSVDWLSTVNIIGLSSTEGVFGTLNYLSANWLLPVGGLFIAIFTGWVLKEALKKEELASEERTYFKYRPWDILIKYVAPIAVLVIIILVLFGRDFG